MQINGIHVTPNISHDQVIVDSQHLVENWGDGAASWWYYVPCLQFFKAATKILQRII